MKRPEKSDFDGNRQYDGGQIAVNEEKDEEDERITQTLLEYANQVQSYTFRWISQRPIKGWTSRYL